MPISREKKELYPKNWREISRRVKEEAGWRCEICGAKHGEAHPETGSKVILTVHHKDGNPANNKRNNLIALCQRCHLREDRELHIKNARETRWRKKREAMKGQGELFPV